MGLHNAKRHRPTAEQKEIRRQRWTLFRQLERMTEKPMVVLALVWIVLMIVEFTQGLGGFLLYLSYSIWAIFIADFALHLIVAPAKGIYLRRNWLTMISLVLPALRVLRVFAFVRFLRLARFARPVGLARIVTSLNRGLRALEQVLRRRGLGYVVAATVLVVFGGGAGMNFFESPAALRAAGHLQAAETGGLADYADAVWWTAMIMTTMGSEYWPHTVEGRILAFLVALYALVVFGYITASIASMFLEPVAGQRPASSAELRELRKEITLLQKQFAKRGSD